MFAEAPITLEAQIDCVERELNLRRYVYPRRVERRQMTQKLADDEMKKMKAVLQTLMKLKRIQDQIRNGERR